MADAEIRPLRLLPSGPPVAEAALADLIEHRDDNEGAFGSYADGVDYAIGLLRGLIEFGTEPVVCRNCGRPVDPDGEAR